MNPEQHPTHPDPGDLPDDAGRDLDADAFDPEATHTGQPTTPIRITGELEVGETPIDETPPDVSIEEAPPIDAPQNDTPEPDLPAPRIVAETPIGGKAPSGRAPLSPARPEPASLEPETEADTDAFEQREPAAMPAPAEPEEPEALEEPIVEAFDPNALTQPGTLQAAEMRAILAVAETAEAAAEAGAGADAEPEPESAPAEKPTPEPRADHLAPARVSSVGEPPHAAAPAQPVSEVDAAGAADWDDDDISPELAAVLFAQQERKSAEAPAKPAAHIDAPAGTAPAGTAPAVAAPAGPVHITDIDQAGSLPLVAEEQSAPAPDTPLAGKVRYVRIEEPLKNNRGQRIRETWKYFQPDRPSLAGRLVQEVKRESITFTDGSQRWTYERHYTDKGRDRREIRANAGGDYIEREDEVSKLDAESGKRLTYREDEQMIFAAQQEEKRGFLSSLLGRDDGPGSAQHAWRQAAPGENRHARKSGGEALRRGFLGFG